MYRHALSVQTNEACSPELLAQLEVRQDLFLPVMLMDKKHFVGAGPMALIYKRAKNLRSRSGRRQSEGSV